MAGAARERNTAHTQKQNEQQKSAQRRLKPPPAQSRRSSFLTERPTLPYGTAAESARQGRHEQLFTAVMPRVVAAATRDQGKRGKFL